MRTTVLLPVVIAFVYIASAQECVVSCTYVPAERSTEVYGNENRRPPLPNLKCLSYDPNSTKLVKYKKANCTKKRLISRPKKQGALKGGHRHMWHPAKGHRVAYYAAIKKGCLKKGKSRRMKVPRGNGLGRRVRRRNGRKGGRRLRRVRCQNRRCKTRRNNRRRIQKKILKTEMTNKL